MHASLFGLAAAALTAVRACDSCPGPSADVVHERLVRRIQPESSEATVDPRAPLEWGQLNFLHTTDTHGWLEGHLKEQNYGADWGDFVSFQRHMKQKAADLGVDLLLVDTGDLHDGSGLSDVTSPNGRFTNLLFEEIAYDVLTIGNHELYVSEVAYEHFDNFSAVWGDKYVTSNVQILNPATGAFDYVGSRYRYFTTAHGLRIMAFGILFDFTLHSNVSRVTTAAELVKQQWFLDAVDFDQPIDLFLLLGHNPARTTAPTNTFALVHQTIRSRRPDTPVQIFGGHSHVRDFQVYDDRTTAMESGRYCETLGWLSMSGIQSSSSTGRQKPRGVAHPTRSASNTSTSGLVYARRYLDWNRRTFAYHARGSQSDTFDVQAGVRVSSEITASRQQLQLRTLYGCAPRTYCMFCKPVGAEGNIYSLIPVALAAVVVNETRADTPRLIIVNSGGIHFDLVKGPFTYDDAFIVSPFKNVFQYIPAVPYAHARAVLAALNGAAGPPRRRDDDASPLGDGMPPAPRDSCDEPALSPISGRGGARGTRPRRRQTVRTPGYVTSDDFGTDGDDTPHSPIPSYEQPDYVQGNASFPTDGSAPTAVDLVFLDYFADGVLRVLRGLGANYTTADVAYYIDEDYSVRRYLPDYARMEWQANMPNCPVGEGVGYEE